MVPMRILLVDDHAIVRQGIRSLLELQEGLQVCGEAASGQQALELVEVLDLDVVLLDVMLPDMEGSEVCRQILLRRPQLQVIILTALASDEQVLRCLRAGAKGYVLKDTDLADLVRTLRAVHRGEAVLHPRVTGAVLSALQRAPEDGGDGLALSPRERQVLLLIAQGLTNRAIGERLFLSVSTVKIEIGNLMEKLGVTSRAAVIYEATRRGLI